MTIRLLASCLALLIHSYAALGERESDQPLRGFSAENQKKQFYERMGLDPADVEWRVQTTNVAGQEIEILIPTPVKRAIRAPVYYEYQDSALIHIPVTQIAERVREHLDALKEAHATTADFLAALVDQDLVTQTFKVELRHSLIGHMGLWSTSDSANCALGDSDFTSPPACLQAIVADILVANSRLVLIRREEGAVPDSLISLLQGSAVEFEVIHIPASEPMVFGLGGTGLLE